MKRTAIVVDDEPIIRIGLCQMMEDIGFHIVGEGEDGFDAVAVCREKKSDIILLDLKMEVFDGISAAETIIKENLAKCVVMCTAYADDESISKAIEIGVSGFLVKPIEQKTLKAAIEVAWAQRQRLSELQKQTAEAYRKIEENKIIEIAKVALAKANNITEAEAYRYMQKSAMKKRVTIASIAKTVVEINAKNNIKKAPKNKK